MSKKIRFPLFLLVPLLIFSCKSVQKIKITENASPALPVAITDSLIKQYPDENLVLIETSKGSMIARLFNETPLHRDNFLKLVQQSFYDSLLFHRVINSFMIQGGDPDSKKAGPEKKLGDGDLKYTIPAEFKKELFHKKGMLCAAREGDDINPQKASSACQFYIVQGKKFDDESLKKAEYRINRELLNKLKNDVLSAPENQYMKLKEEKFRSEKNNDSLLVISKKIEELILPVYEKTPHYTFSEEQKQTYKTIGGTPHLDGSYTVFGEIVYGQEVIHKIAGSATNKDDRPLENIRMKMTILKKY